MAPITFSCSGGTAGSTASTDIFLTLNTNITNRVSSAGSPTNISVTADTGTGSGPLPVAATIQYSGNNTVILNQVTYVVPTPNTTPVTVQISGIRAAVANITEALPLAWSPLRF